MSKQSESLAPFVAKFSDEANPATILIQKEKGAWHDELGLTTVTEMETRLKARESKYLEQWGNRKKGSQGKPPKKEPRYRDIPDHKPPILVAGEWVRFECAQPFLAIVMPETELEQSADGPSSPFVGTDSDFPFAENSKLDPKRSVHYVLRQVSPEADRQLFYKLLFVVMDKPNKKPELVDPDFFCDR